MNQHNQDSHKRFIGFYKKITAVFPILAFVIAVTYSASMFAHYDSVIGHFERGSVPFFISVSVSVIAAVLSVLAVIASYKKASFAADPGENPVTFSASVLCVLMSIAVPITAAVDYSHGMITKFGGISAILIPFVGITMALSISEKMRFSPVRRITAILGILGLNISMFADYFDFTLPLNSPVRNFVTVVKAAALLHLLSEARFAFGAASRRPELGQTVFASGAAASLTLGYSFGAILTSLFGGIASNPNPGVFELGVLLAIGIHAAGRLFTLVPAVGIYVPREDDKKKKNKADENSKSENKK